MDNSCKSGNRRMYKFSGFLDLKCWGASNPSCGGPRLWTSWCRCYSTLINQKFSDLVLSMSIEIILGFTGILLLYKFFVFIFIFISLFVCIFGVHVHSPDTEHIKNRGQHECICPSLPTWKFQHQLSSCSLVTSAQPTETFL